MKYIIIYAFVLLLVISCTNKKIKKRYYCDMNNIYISVSEGDKYDSLIIVGIQILSLFAKPMVIMERSCSILLPEQIQFM